jgi:hypothetical protein
MHISAPSPSLLSPQYLIAPLTPHQQAIKTPTLYFLIELALRFRSSERFCFSSDTRLARSEAYSLCLSNISIHPSKSRTTQEGITHRLILTVLRTTTLERDPVTLVLEALGGHETLDLGGFAVGLLAFAFGLDFAADDERADVVVFVEAEELADFGSAFGAEAFGVDLLLG